MDDHPALRIVQPGETVQVQAPAGDALIIVTDRRMAVANAQRLMLDVPIEGLRRIQFDIERRRPATLVIVPEEREYDPQVLAIEPSGFEAVARALVTLGHRFAAMADEKQTVTRRVGLSRTPTQGDESWTGGRDARLPDIRWAPVGLLVRNVHASHPRTGPTPNRHSSRVTASGPSPWPMPRHRGAREQRTQIGLRADDAGGGRSMPALDPSQKRAGRFASVR
jgi:hypothetical protein